MWRRDAERHRTYQYKSAATFSRSGEHWLEQSDQRSTTAFGDFDDRGDVDDNDSRQAAPRI
jgi:hypothetical protein